MLAGIPAGRANSFQPPIWDMPRLTNAAVSESARWCDDGLLRTANRYSPTISSSLACERSAARKSISASDNRQGRNRPSAVRRNRLQRSQKQFEIGSMNP